MAADLKSNQTLKELKLSRNELNAESAKFLGHGIAENRSPLTFRMSSDQLTKRPCSFYKGDEILLPSYIGIIS